MTTRKKLSIIARNKNKFRKKSFKLKGGRTPLETAIENDDIDQVKTFLDEDIELVKTKPYIARTYLTFAIKHGDTEMIKKILDKGIDINIQEDIETNTFLNIAVKHGDPEIVQMILDNGADINMTVKNHSPPLITAVLYMDTNDESKVFNMVELLLNNGAEPNKKSPIGSVPVNYAGWKGFTKVAKLLLDRGADPTIKDVNGANAITRYAIHSGKPLETLKYIQSYPVTKEEDTIFNPMHKMGGKRRRTTKRRKQRK
jgi:ankyrin repeat protein